jgi:hypothetical protein
VIWSLSRALGRAAQPQPLLGEQHQERALITTLPIFCPVSTYLYASTIWSSGYRRSMSGLNASVSIDEGLGRPQAAVRPVHRCGANLDQHLVVLGRRLVQLYRVLGIGLIAQVR